MSKKSKKSARFRRINSKEGSAVWRDLPATEAQWSVLKRIGRESGARFAEGISRGEASRVIGERFAADPAAARASRRAGRRRAREWRAAGRSGDRGLRPC